MSASCLVLIATPDLLPALKQRTTDADGEVLAFSDADALRALEVITKRRPRVVVLERSFAATPRGAALINRIKADPALVESELRVVSHDAEYTRMSPRKPGEATAVAAPPPPPAPAAVVAPAALDQRGTRRAPRYRIAGIVEVLLDGNPATLVDLSILGAQVVSPTILKPNQRVRMALPEDQATIRFNASIAWASFEMPRKSGPQYRAGVAFADADAAALERYIARHKVG